MSEAVLISIRPKWCEMIASGKKTIEVRKTRPQIKTPFKCYIYCTKDNKAQFWKAHTYSYLDDHSHNVFDQCGNGKVIGEFICDGIQDIIYHDDGEHQHYQWIDAPAWAFFLNQKACLTDKELSKYLTTNDGYGWHISTLKIYDNPKNLFEFMKPCDPDTDGVPLCSQCKRLIENYGCGGTIPRPPMSWCYVEELP